MLMRFDPLRDGDRIAQELWGQSRTQLAECCDGCGA